MGSRQNTVDFLLGQLAGAGALDHRKMFGEYAIYCDQKLAVLVCDDQFYLKPTEAGRRFLGSCQEQAPYPGCKPWLLIDGERWDDREWLVELVRVTALNLPPPKPKVPRKLKPAAKASADPGPGRRKPRS